MFLLLVVFFFICISFLFFSLLVSIVEPAAVATPIWDKNTGDNAQINQIPEEKRQIYEHIYNEDVKKSVKSLVDNASGPEVVTEAVKNAIMSSFPQTRYVVASVHGAPAWILKLLTWLLPDRMADVIFGGAM